MFNFTKVICSIILISLFSDCKCIKYCSVDYCDNSNQHTLCKFQSEDPARHCIGYMKTIKTEKEKQAILDKLNSRRNKVAAGEIRSLPSAENMMKLEWNEELEKSAQRWADQCVKHSVPDIKDTCRDLGNVYVGQNIATISGESPGLTPMALVDVWYMELLNINASVLPQYRPSAETAYSHYDYFTQLVWAESHQVGCGGVKFKERITDSNNEKKNRMIYRLVCNFAPGGNRRNHSVYSEGLPCSLCEAGGYCDSAYKALCSSNSSSKQHKVSDQIQSVRTNESVIPSTEIISLDNVSEVTQPLFANTKPFEIKPSATTESTINDEEYTPFDYFSHLHDFTRRMLSTATTSSVSCKDVLAVDDFVELLKKKLSTDPMFKEILLTTKVPIQLDGGFTDASVAALISRIYSKKVPPTTTKSSDSDYVNSTLLVDLVEAVIFRNGDKIQRSEDTELRTEGFDVNPVKIQAEFAEVKPNSDFTGHYFFPEDDNDEESNSAITESYYDTSNLPISDVVLEIEDLKRNKATKDFLEEILESESVTESTTTLSMLSPDDINLFKSGQSSMKKFLEEIAKEKL